ncbi:uncharacterized protein LOC103929113 isoform X1 [Pyrus x bretschneideri]|uniref:uncharacterized protein LOC103929113 isoform X1 n=1 Tax=Pyrus x bretschneideri TaxID=225117 RepID=UPI00202DE2D5|nr:uncharacterized protein LOC103929113 isoform X1 [Pyrus x bretschneideri]
MKRRFEGGPGEPAEGESPIPAQPTKLRGEVQSPSIDAGKNKEIDSVKDSPTTHLTKVEAAQDSQTQFQLEEEDTVPTFLKEDNNPTCLADELINKPGTFSSMPSSCEICSKPDHWYDMCPWRKRLPKGVTQVGKGYVVERGRAVRLECVYCHEIGTHMLNDCPHFKKLLEENGGDAPWHLCFLGHRPLADC